MRITRKLGVLVAVPLVAVVAFAALALVTSGAQAVQAEQLRSLVAAGAPAAELAQELRVERANAVVALSSGAEDDVDAFVVAADASDAARDEYTRAVDALDSPPDSMKDLLGQIDTHYADLEELRKVVRSGDQTATAAAFAYRIAIADLLSFRELVAQAGGTSVDAAEQLQASVSLSEAIEYVGLQQVAVLRSLDGNEMTAAAYQEIAGTRTGYTEAIQSFRDQAEPQWRRWLDESLSAADIREAQQMESQAGRVLPGSALEIDSADWNQKMSARSDILQSVLTQIDSGIGATVTDQRDSQRLVTGLETLAVIVAVALAVLLAVWMGRPVVRGLRRLRDAARQVATVDLPDAVARLDNHEVLGELTPEQFADGMPPPVEVIGQDELAEVGHAFNEVQREAVRVAAEQALLRLHIGAIFVNLARRGHALASRLTAAIDEAERSELDPERLEKLFALDHLVTLLGRSNDSLLVLGGTSPAKVRLVDEPVGDVLTAAQSQIEQYKRIEIGSVDSGVAVRATVVDDVVKLLAELMDNATAYSEPAVAVTSRSLDDRTIIQITDHGIGISADDLVVYNARLATRPILDLDAVRAMGLTVVGHIASRLGITVQLRPGKENGTIAEVTLPSSLLNDVAGPPTGPIDQPAPEPVKVPRLFQENPSDSSGADEPETVAIPILQFDLQNLHPDQTGPMPVQTGGISFQDGWRVAEEAAARTEEAASDSLTGLPHRVPGDQLVPGGDLAAESTTPQSDYRDPAAVSATYAAYAKGRSATPATSLTDNDRSRAAQ